MTNDKRPFTFSCREDYQDFLAFCCKKERPICGLGTANDWAVARPDLLLAWRTKLKLKGDN